MTRPPRPVRCRVRVNTLAALSLAGLVLLGGPSPAADGAWNPRGIFQEMRERIRPGGLDRPSRPILRRRTASRGAEAHKRRGAAHLRRREFAAARREFTAASAREPRDWTAAYQLAETDFRQGRHDAARQQFEKLRGTAPSRADRDLVGYQALLADLRAGREEPAQRFLAESDRRGRFSPAYFYLQSALARHRGQRTAAERWLTQAELSRQGRKVPPELRERYADALRGPERPADGGEPASRRPRSRPPGDPTEPSTPARVAMVEVFPAPSAPPPPEAPDRGDPSAPTPVPAFRSLVPGGPVPSSSTPPPAARRENSAENAPPEAEPVPLQAASRRPADPARGRKEPAAPAAAATSSPAAAPAATPTPPPGKPLAEAPVEVREKFEVAQGLYSRRDYPGALRLLAEIETLQANVREVRNLRALVHYEVGYRHYIQQDYASALRELDEADEAQAVADTANLRGLVHARQRQYDRAEAAFRRAVAADPTLWAAKFNLADLPFGYRNYTEARQRFEALTAETDRATQPRQAELTEFKVFLTLLLEGRESAARSFLLRFKPDGATPARIYGQAALDFHAGRFDKAIESVKEARKKYPPQLEAIFAESFYRVGWLTDGMIAPSTAVAAATPTPTDTPDPAAAVAAATSSPTPAPAAVAVASPPPPPPAPSPEPTPTPAVAVAAVSPPPAPTAPPAPSPTAEPTAALAVATPAPTPVAAPSPVPTATPAPAAVAVTSPPPVAETPAPPAATVAPAVAVTPTPPTPAPSATTRSPAERLIRGFLPWVVLLYLLAPWFYAVRVILNRRRRRFRARRVVSLPRYPNADKVLESEKV